MGLIIKSLIIVNGLAVKDIYINMTHLRFISDGGNWTVTCHFNYYNSLRKLNNPFYNERLVFHLQPEEMNNNIAVIYQRFLELKQYRNAENA